MQISIELKRNFDYDSVDAACQKFEQFWTQHAPPEVATLRRTPPGFDIFELYEGETHHRGEILFCPASSGDRQIIFRVGIPAGQVYFFENAPRPFSEQKLLDIFEDFCQSIGLNAPGLQKVQPEESKGKPQPPDKDAIPNLWFDWFYRVKEAEYKITIPKLAEAWGYSESWIKEQKSLYDAEFGKNSIPKQD